jgi:uncharacterized protein
MPLKINLRRLEAHNARLQGELPVGELDIDPRDEAIRLGLPLEYDLEAQALEDSLLVEGTLRLKLKCECVRCLKPFQYQIELAPWTCHLPLKGEEAVPVINDCVDLTPSMREDILLEFPQHPLCSTDCQGLPAMKQSKPGNTSSIGQPKTGSPAWVELSKLKF